MSRRRPRSRPVDVRAALRAPIIDHALPADEPLHPHEVRAMKAHLRFLRGVRKPLGIRVNAEEDLLLNGAREPSHRGVCLKLLSKVDHSAVMRALDRIDAPRARTDLLAGVVRFSDDLGILLLYLESLADSASKAKAAGAFSLAVARMDLGAASPARITRLLELLATCFDGHERAQVLFGLLHAPGFAERFDAIRGELPRDLQQVIGPLAAVHEEIILGQETRHGPGALRTGCELLLSAPADTLRAYPLDVRTRLLESAVALVRDERTADRAAATLLESIDAAPEEYRRLALLRAADLMRRHADERARWVLKRLQGAQAKCTEAALWRDALESRHVGRFAMGWPDDTGRRIAVEPPPKGKGKLARAWSLDGQVSVWLRTAPGSARQAVSKEAALHSKLVLPGLAPLIGSNTKGKTLALAVPAWGEPAALVLPRLKDRRTALDLALQATQILGGLAFAGIKLPDARRWRWLVDTTASPPRLLLAVLQGATEVAALEALKAHGGSARGFARELLDDHERDLPPPLRRLLLRRRPRLDALQGALAEALSRGD